MVPLPPLFVKIFTKSEIITKVFQVHQKKSGSCCFAAFYTKHFLKHLNFTQPVSLSFNGQDSVLWLRSLPQLGGSRLSSVWTEETSQATVHIGCIFSWSDSIQKSSFVSRRQSIFWVLWCLYSRYSTVFSLLMTPLYSSRNPGLVAQAWALCNTASALSKAYLMLFHAAFLCTYIQDSVIHEHLCSKVKQLSSTRHFIVPTSYFSKSFPFRNYSYRHWTKYILHCFWDFSLVNDFLNSF